MPANIKTRYETDGGDIHPITMKPATYTVAGTPPSGTPTQNIKVQISKSSRSYGLKPRGLTLSRTLGTAPDTFTKSAFLPILTPADFALPGNQNGSSITIGGVIWIVVGRRGEDYN